jgi:hypothetical protein
MAWRAMSATDVWWMSWGEGAELPVLEWLGISEGMGVRDGAKEVGG